MLLLARKSSIEGQLFALVVEHLIITSIIKEISDTKFFNLQTVLIGKM